MSASVRWDGLDELRAQLRALPDDLTGEAAHIAEGKANAAAADIKAGYGKHRRSGHLQDGVVVTHFEGHRFSAGAVVKSTAPHAWIFENGTEARHTDLGANRGSAPPGHIFIPAVMRRRREMYEELQALLQRHGLTVSGDA